MGKSMETRAYTNFILTVIAALLLALTVHAYRLTDAPAAHAQEFGETLTQPRAPEPAVAQQQDLAVAAATNNVAAANKEIANAIRDLAGAVADVRLNAAGPAAAPAAGAAAPVGAGTIELGVSN